jgi:hypothetical protein
MLLEPLFEAARHWQTCKTSGLKRSMMSESGPLAKALSYTRRRRHSVSAPAPSTFDAQSGGRVEANAQARRVTGRPLDVAPLEAQYRCDAERQLRSGARCNLVDHLQRFGQLVLAGACARLSR